MRACVYACVRACVYVCVCMCPVKMELYDKDSESRTGSTIYNEITRDYVNIVHEEAVWTF